eukprot:XP_023156297.1 blue copper protein isoform X1 [Zea mays]
MASSNSKQALLLAAVACLASLASATQWTVGDEGGWRARLNETAWTDGKTFTVGDTLRTVRVPQGEAHGGEGRQERLRGVRPERQPAAGELDQRQRRRDAGPAGHGVVHLQQAHPLPQRHEARHRRGRRHLRPSPDAVPGSPGRSPVSAGAVPVLGPGGPGPRPGGPGPSPGPSSIVAAVCSREVPGRRRGGRRGSRRCRGRPRALALFSPLPAELLLALA